MADLIQMRGDTESNWQIKNPVIADREMVFSIDLDPIKFKIGNDKNSNWNTLPYFAGLNGKDGKDGEKGSDGAKGADGKDGVDGKDGTSADHDAVVTLQGQVKTLQEQPWTIVSVLPNPTPSDVRIDVPMTRGGLCKAIDVYVYGKFVAGVTVRLYKNGAYLAQQLLTQAGKNTFTGLGTGITCKLDDTFGYDVNSDGLKEAMVLCNQKWVNY